MAASIKVETDRLGDDTNALSLGVAGLVGAGALGGFYTESSERPYFLIIGGASIAVGVLVALLSRWINKMMIDVR